MNLTLQRIEVRNLPPYFVCCIEYFTLLTSIVLMHISDIPPSGHSMYTQECMRNSALLNNYIEFYSVDRVLTLMTPHPQVIQCKHTRIKVKRTMPWNIEFYSVDRVLTSVTPTPHFPRAYSYPPLARCDHLTL